MPRGKGKGRDEAAGVVDTALYLDLSATETLFSPLGSWWSG